MALTDFDLVLFGGSGDLSMRKLLPALYNRDRLHDLPSSARIVCVGRHGWNRDEFLKEVEQNAKPHVAEFDNAVWDTFCARIQYVALDANDPATYQALVEAMRPEMPDYKIIRVFYLATPPSLFAKICHNLSACGLATPSSRVVLEKPLGRDLASARQINAEVGRVFS
jgi:glucose-6-phosphate 1-dehydrogenase